MVIFVTGRANVFAAARIAFEPRFVFAPDNRTIPVLTNVSASGVGVAHFVWFLCRL